MDAKVTTCARQVTNAQKICYVTWKDLPLSCPMPAMSLWNSHQRVYLPIQESGHEQCPYCGTLYVLTTPTSPDDEIVQPNVEIENLHHQAITRERRNHG